MALLPNINIPAMENLRRQQLREMNQDQEVQQSTAPVVISDIFGIRNLFSLRQALNPLAGARHIYCTLKKSQADPSVTDRLHWTIAPQGTARRQPSVIYLQELPSNIAAIKLIAVTCTFVIGSEINDIIQNNGRIGLLLDELQIQASNVSSNRLHFMIKPLFSGYIFQDSNACNFGAYWFDPPILSLPSITFSVFDPIQRIPATDIEDFQVSLEIIYYGGPQSVQQ